MQEALSGNLCRCTGYQGVVAAVLDAAERLSDGAKGIAMDGAHPGQRQGRRLVDGADGGMAVGTAHEGGVQHAGHGDVVDEPRLAAQQRRILQPLAAGCGDLLAHRALPPSMAIPFAPSLSRSAASNTAATTP